jgi:hypothetical protein
MSFALEQNFTYYGALTDGELSVLPAEDPREGSPSFVPRTGSME